MSGSKRALFGTDGVRGRANVEPMTPETALALGKAAGAAFMRRTGRHRAVIGKDTRLSGYMFEPALVAGLVSAGMDVILVGPLPTPAIGMLTRSLRGDLGVMISASHNPHHDNGVKLFGPDGFKLSDAEQAEIESRLDNGNPGAGVDALALGRARRLDDARGRYIEFVKATFPKNRTLSGLTVVLDCANGAAWRVAPIVLWELGAEVIPIGVSPDGLNINENCGSTAPEAMARKVKENGAAVGVALDGDADRVVMCDEKGALIDGDQLLATVAEHFRETGRLRGGGVVATHMSNLGLERHLAGLGLRLERTGVGDRNVVDGMRRGGYNLGGEQSGHIVLTDYATTGDGLIAALQVLSAVIASGAPASRAARRFDPLPQRMRSVPCRPGALESSAVAAAVAAAERRLGSGGRVVVRMSGTEAGARVMAQGEDEDAVDAAVADIVAAIREAP